MLWIYALLQFLFIIGLEIGAVLDFKYYKEGESGKLVLVSGGMALIGCLATVIYVDNRWMIIPDVGGAMFGVLLAAKVWPYQKGDEE